MPRSRRAASWSSTTTAIGWERATPRTSSAAGLASQRRSAAWITPVTTGASPEDGFNASPQHLQIDGLQVARHVVPRGHRSRRRRRPRREQLELCSDFRGLAHEEDVLWEAGGQLAVRRDVAYHHRRPYGEALQQCEALSLGLA